MKIVQAEEFFYQKCNANNLAFQTLQYYKFALENFNKFLEKVHITDIENVNTLNVYDYLTEIKEKYSPATYKGRFVAIKAFFNYCERAEIIPVNPIKRMPLPKISRKIIYSFNKNEIQEILAMFDKSKFIELRNYTIICLLFGTGIRKSELLGLTVGDLQAFDNTIKVYGKGNKERYIPISDNLQRLLKRYINRRNKYINDNGKNNLPALFITKDCRSLAVGGVNTLFNKIKNSKPVWSTRVSAHTWRHTFAKMFLLNGGDLFTLQKILGHEDISTTRIYLDLNNEELKVQNEKFNPLDNTRWQYY